MTADGNTLQIFMALFSLVGTIFSGVMMYLLRRLDTQQKIRAEESNKKVDEVKNDLISSNQLGNDKIDSLAKNTALKVAEVKTALEKNNGILNEKIDNVGQAVAENTASGTEQISNLSDVAKATHKLVDGNMSRQLRLNKLVTRRLADVTKDPTDVLLAEEAEKNYKEHESVEQSTGVKSDNTTNT